MGKSEAIVCRIRRSAILQYSGSDFRKCLGRHTFRQTPISPPLLPYFCLLSSKTCSSTLSGIGKSKSISKCSPHAQRHKFLLANLNVFPSISIVFTPFTSLRNASVGQWFMHSPHISQSFMSSYIGVPHNGASVIIEMKRFHGPYSGDIVSPCHPS